MLFVGYFFGYLFAAVLLLVLVALGSDHDAYCSCPEHRAHR